MHLGGSGGACPPHPPPCVILAPLEIPKLQQLSSRCFKLCLHATCMYHGRPHCLPMLPLRLPKFTPPPHPLGNFFCIQPQIWYRSSCCLFLRIRTFVFLTFFGHKDFIRRQHRYRGLGHRSLIGHGVVTTHGRALHGLSRTTNLTMPGSARWMRGLGRKVDLHP